MTHVRVKTSILRENNQFQPRNKNDHCKQNPRIKDEILFISNLCYFVNNYCFVKRNDLMLDKLIS